MKESRRDSSKIRILCQLFYPELISTGQTLTELSEELVRLGVEVEVICGPPTILDRKSKVPRRMEHQGIQVKRVWGTRFSKLSFFGKLSNQITYTTAVFFRLFFDSDTRPWLVLTDPPFLGGMCALLRKFGRNPFIYVIFDIYPDTAVKAGILSERGLFTRFWNWWNRFILRQASQVVVIGRCMKSVILSKGVSIPQLEKKVNLIYNWCDDRMIQPVQREENPYIQKWKLEDKFVVSYSGNLGRFHDMETIIAGASALKAHPEIVFLFTGEGYKKRQTQEFVALNEMRNCQFHTYVKREELGFALSCAHVGLVSLASSQEGLSVPTKTFGIMASETPVIAIMSDESEIAHIIAENNCGYVIAPGDVDGLVRAVLELYGNPEKQQEFGNNALNAVKDKYNLRNSALKYLSLIETLSRE
ncbi:glycosyltransferase family 4 protein [Acidobacteriota bacterium]